MVPIKLILQNFISHINSTLDFTEFNSALIIGSFEGDSRIANGVGKTALFSGIQFALYGKSKFSKKTKIIKRGKPSCKVEFQFQTNNELYRITRTLDKKSGLLGVNFAKQIDGKFEDEGLTGDTPTQTNNNIIQIIGMNHDVFVNVVYFSQNDVSGFASANSSKRKDILKEALQIGVWDDFQNVAKDSEKKLMERFKTIDTRIKSLEDTESLLEKNNKEIGAKEIEINKLQSNILHLEEKYNKCLDKISYLESTISKNDIETRTILENKINEINNRLIEIKNNKEILVNNIKNNNVKLSNSNNDNEGLKQRLLSYYKDILIVEHELRSEIKREYKFLTKDPVLTIKYSENSLKENISKKDNSFNKLKILEHELKQLISLEVGEECPACLTVFDNPKGVAEKRKIKQKEIEYNIKENNLIINELNKNILKEKEAIEKANKASIEIERTNLIMAKISSNILDINKHNENAQKELKLLANEWKILKNNKQEILKSIDKLDNVSELNNELQELVNTKDTIFNKINNLKEQIFKNSIEAGNKKGYKEELERRKTEKDVLVEEKDTIISDLSVYSKLSKAFGKDGIQSIIMENITEDLRQYANNILKDIYYKSMTVDFITQKQQNNGKWKEDFDIIITKDGELFDFEDVSGGEQVRVSIAIRLALSQLLMRRVGTNVKFLLFDEVDQSLDKHGLEVLAEVINKLSNEFKILVITHSEYMKEKFEHVITVHMESEGSKLI